MAEYIEREAALSAQNKSMNLNEMRERLKRIPAADVRPVVRGEWEKTEDFDEYGGGRHVEWTCSECFYKAKGDWADKMCKTLSDIFGDSGVFDFSHFKELSKAESEGRLLVLPCKVGDTVYTAQRGVVSELSVDHFELYNVGIWVSWHLMSGIYGNFRMDGFPASDIGKTVFLTRAAAEAALKQEVESDG